MVESKHRPAGSLELLLGNEAIARGALEAGVQFCAGYPGTPSSEIIGTIAQVAKERGIHVEWSVNEKVAAEGAAAASIAGLRSLATMKNAGLNVASDFLQHLSLSGTGSSGGGMVVVAADDPSAWYSGDEQDSRWFAESAVVPLLVPDSVQEAKDMMRWAFELSETFKVYCLFCSYTRLAHRTGVVKLDAIPNVKRTAGIISELITNEDPWTLRRVEDAFRRLEQIREVFESSPFNWYRGPSNPELLVICCGNGSPCALEAIDSLGLEDSVGILKLGTVWPIPRRLIDRYLAETKQVIVLEETDPFLELHVKEMVADSQNRLEVYGRNSGHIKRWGELTPNTVSEALSKVLRRGYSSIDSSYVERVENACEMLVNRSGGWCAGCPHRASLWAVKEAFRKDRRNGFVIGDIGCYAMDVMDSGFNLMKILHSMGAGTGVGCGLGQLGRFGFTQPFISICGDSTFFHSSIPALVNAIYNKSSMMLIVLDNTTTAMTGFQPHPGTGSSAIGEDTPVIDIADFCSSLGCKVAVRDPFDITEVTNKVLEFMRDEEGVRVLVLRRDCELVRMRREKRYPFRVEINSEMCTGEKCQYCTSVFKCPGLAFDKETGKAAIVDGICVHCGVCVDICPVKAITRKEIV